jgi:hypothetical protein
MKTCIACDYVETAVRRRVFFTLVEGLGEFWFIRAMESGGFCLRHLRRIVAAGGGAALTGAYLDVVEGWARRLGEVGAPDRRIGASCYLCETQRWAEGFALDLLAREDRDYARTQLGRLEPLCLHHLESLAALVPWHRVPGVAAQLAGRRRQAADLDAAQTADAIEIVAGRDRDAAIRQDAGNSLVSDAVPPVLVHDPSRAWAGGALSISGLHGELDGGRCPACSAAAAAARNYLGWLAQADRTPEQYRDRDALCADHLQDAWSFAPLAAERSLAGALEHWQRSADVLEGLAAPPSARVVDRLRASPAAWSRAWRSRSGIGRVSTAVRAVAGEVARPGRAIDAGRALAAAQRRRPCVACQAMSTAAGRTLELLGSLLGGSAGVRAFEETRGLCLRHVGVAWGSLGGPERDVILGVARARTRQVRWELQEAIRKSSWSVRYEPAGPETGAWQRALILVLGEDVTTNDLLAAEPEVARPAA